MEKYIGNSVTVDLGSSRMVRDWGRGDAKVELWADAGNKHVWLETNGGPVNSVSDVTMLLLECGMDRRAVEAVVAGDVDAAMGQRTTNADKMADALGRPGDVPPGYDRSDWNA